MEYDTLRGMTKNEYIDHYKSLHQNTNLNEKIENIEKSDFVNNTAEFDKEFLIQSINQSELCTVTLHFFKVHGADDIHVVNKLINTIENDVFAARQELGIYTARCYLEHFDHVRGIPSRNNDRLNFTKSPILNGLNGHDRVESLNRKP